MSTNLDNINLKAERGPYKQILENEHISLVSAVFEVALQDDIEDLNSHCTRSDHIEYCDENSSHHRS